MKKLKILGVILMTAICSVAFAQKKEDVKNVSKIAEGTALTDVDLGFINMATNAGKSRGDETTKTAMIGKTTFTAGQKLSKADAATINKALGAYTKTHKGNAKTSMKAKSRGSNYCYWYYYCWGGYCRYYWYCY